VPAATPAKPPRTGRRRKRALRSLQRHRTLGGEHIGHVDDTGFTVDDDFVDGVLHRDGMTSYRQW
jgi:hypothetical protein